MLTLLGEVVGWDYAMAKMRYFPILFCLCFIVSCSRSLGFTGFKTLSSSFKFQTPVRTDSPSVQQKILKSGLETLNTSVSDLEKRMGQLETAGFNKDCGAVPDEVKEVQDKQTTLNKSVRSIQASVKRMEENVEAAIDAQKEKMESLVSENERLKSLIQDMIKTNPESTTNNLALNKPTKSSSSVYFGSPAGPVDGSPSVDWWSGSCFTAEDDDKNPWWQVDLGSAYNVTDVNISTRGDYHIKLQDVAIELFTEDPTSVSDTPPSLCCEYIARKQKRGVTIRCRCTEPTSGRYLRITGASSKEKHQGLSFCEVQVFEESNYDTSQ